MAVGVLTAFSLIGEMFLFLEICVVGDHSLVATWCTFLPGE